MLFLLMYKIDVRRRSPREETPFLSMGTPMQGSSLRLTLLASRHLHRCSQEKGWVWVTELAVLGSAPPPFFCFGICLPAEIRHLPLPSLPYVLQLSLCCPVMSVTWGWVWFTVEFTIEITLGSHLNYAHQWNITNKKVIF